MGGDEGDGEEDGAGVATVGAAERDGDGRRVGRDDAEGSGLGETDGLVWNDGAAEGARPRDGIADQAGADWVHPSSAESPPPKATPAPKEGAAEGDALLAEGAADGAADGAAVAATPTAEGAELRNAPVTAVVREDDSIDISDSAARDAANAAVTTKTRSRRSFV